MNKIKVFYSQDIWTDANQLGILILRISTHRVELVEEQDHAL